MSAPDQFVKLDQTVKALNKEILDNHPAAATLKQTLQNAWTNVPYVVGQEPRTATKALQILNTDPKLLQPLGKFKSQKTNESTYSGKRAYKRLYINSDAVRVWNDTNNVSPWACEWRLGSTKQELTAGGFRATDGDSQAKYLSAMALPLFDYDDLPNHQIYTKFENHFEVINTDFASGTHGWTNTTAGNTSKLKIKKSGRYLITGNLQLRLFTKSKSEFRYDNLNDINEINEIDNPTQTVDVSEILNSKADFYYPYARIKMIQSSLNTTTNKIEIKNVLYSGKVSMTPTKANERKIAAGFSALITINENDFIEFSLERSHRTMKIDVYDLGGNKVVTEAICCQKTVNGYNSDRDIGNYFEFTRISGLD